MNENQAIPNVPTMGEEQLKRFTKKQVAEALANAETRCLHHEQQHSNLMDEIDKLERSFQDNTHNWKLMTERAESAERKSQDLTDQMKQVRDAISTIRATMLPEPRVNMNRTAAECCTAIEHEVHPYVTMDDLAKVLRHLDELARGAMNTARRGLNLFNECD